MHNLQKSIAEGTFTLNANQVFDTYLKSDEQHEVAGQKINHGGSSLCH
jgi:hypothetical protein